MSDTSESAASRRDAATDDGLSEPVKGSNRMDKRQSLKMKMFGPF